MNDSIFIDLLNNIRLGEISIADEELLLSKFINSDDQDYPFEALHIFAENRPALAHNELMLNKINKIIFASLYNFSCNKEDSISLNAVLGMYST